MKDILYCADSVNRWFDLSVAPKILLYAYIPILLLTLFFALYIHVRSKHTNYAPKIFLVSSLFFIAWIGCALLTWILTPASLVYLFWALTFIIEPLFFASFLYFHFYLINNKFPAFKYNIFILAPLAIFSIMLFFGTMEEYFDLTSCELVTSNVTYLTYLYQFLIVGFLVLNYFKFNTSVIKNNHRNLTVALTAFLLVFLVSTSIGQYYSWYEVNLIGPISMLLVLGVMGYSISQGSIFSVKIMWSQILVAAILFFNVSILFLWDLDSIRIIVLFTTLINLVIGRVLIKNTKLIDTQRAELAVSNREQEILIHFITHQIKGFFTKSRNIFDTLSDQREAFSPSLNRLIDEGLRSDKEGVELVENILHASNLRTGKIKYADERFELNPLVEGLIKELQPAATAKSLTINYYAPSVPIQVKADQARIKDLIKNLVQNAVLYTFKGGVNVSLAQKGDEVELVVKDTGIGLTPSDKARLFQSGGRGEESVKYNTGSTGYGLFIAKKVVDNYKGYIWAESEGRDKGSKFTVVLPIVQPLVK